MVTHHSNSIQIYTDRRGSIVYRKTQFRADYRAGKWGGATSG